MAENVEITFLGTGSAVPTARRNHTGILLKYKAENILFDCGEGIQRQFRFVRMSPCKITRIFISHWHGDHILGLAGLFQTLTMNDYSGKLEIYGPIGSKKKVQELIEVFMKQRLKESLNGDNHFEINVHDVDEGVILDFDEYKIEATRTFHRIISLAYSFIVKEKNRIDKDKLKKFGIGNSPLISELVKGKTITFNGKKIDGKKIIYKEPAKKISIILDTKRDDSLAKFAKDSNILICESTYSLKEQDKADLRFHLSTSDAAKIAKDSDSNLLVLTHLSQRYSEIPKVLEEEAKKIFKNSKVVEDFDQIII